MAGMQVIWSVINLSPQWAHIDFVTDRCLYHDFNPDDIDSYYEHYGDMNDDWHVAFRKFTEIDDLSAGAAGTVGYWNLAPKVAGEPTPFYSFGYENRGSGDCFGLDNKSGFNMQVGDPDGPTTYYELLDPTGSSWKLYENDTEIDLGSGGYFNWAPLTAIGNLFKGKEPDYESEAVLEWDFTTVYDGVRVDDRSACILEKDVAGGTDCLVTGVALIILPNGKVTAMPLPDNKHNW